MGFDTSSPAIGAGGPPTGGAGGDLTGTYPNPTIKTPVTLGVVTVTSINRLTLTAPATGSTITIVDGKVLTVSKTLSFTGTDSTVMTFPTTSATIARTDAAQTFTGTQSFAGTDLSAVAPTVAANHVGYGATVQSTVGSPGGASAVPLTPDGYLIINVAGTAKVIPYFAAS